MTGQPCRVGYQRTAAYVLSLPWPDNVVSRLTVAAAMPRANALGYAVADDRARENLKRFLRTCERREHVTRGQRFVRVLDPKALRDHAFDKLPFQPVLPDDFIDVNRVVGIIRRQLSFEQNPGVRRLIHVEVELLESLDSGR